MEMEKIFKKNILIAYGTYLFFLFLKDLKKYNYKIIFIIYIL